MYVYTVRHANVYPLRQGLLHLVAQGVAGIVEQVAQVIVVGGHDGEDVSGGLDGHAAVEGLAAVHLQLIVDNVERVATVGIVAPHVGEDTCARGGTSCSECGGGEGATHEGACVGR